MGNQLTEIRFTASTELMEKLKRVKGLLGHQLKDFSYAALLDQLTDIAIKKYDPRERPVRATRKQDRPVKVATPPSSYYQTDANSHHNSQFHAGAGVA